MSEAEMDEQPQGFVEIQQQELSRLADTVMRGRLFVAPLAALVAALISLIEPNGWRSWALGIGVVALLVLAVVEWWRFRQAGLRDLTVGVNVVLMIGFQLVVIFATGGLESPLMPAILPLGFVGTVLIGPATPLAFQIAVQLLAIWWFALGAVGGTLPDVALSFFGEGARSGHNDALLITAAATYTVLIAIITGVGLRVRRLFDDMLREALRAREEALTTHSAHARELTVLSGEIAHELKNPLTSVKALAALLDRDATGRSAERLRILRAEVDRMQVILEEFLNFSRPLTPLAYRAFSIADTCQDVITLHEGVLRSRGLTLALQAPTGAPLPLAWADPRKVRQILINLVQNAVEASPEGSSILARLSAPDGATCVEVLDQGRGLPDEPVEHLFEPGVTTREKGSGLGLTIARTLARQHGGEVTLRQNPGGGCIARLTLPPRTGADA